MSNQRTERCRDLIGKTVKLKRDLVTNGGRAFRQGTLLLVTGTWRGRFDLQNLPGHGVRNALIRKVPRLDFEVVK